MWLMTVVVLCCLVADCLVDANVDGTIRKRTCRVGLHSHNCAIIDLEKLKSFGNYLRSGESPGKRDVEPSRSDLGERATSEEFRAAYEALENLVEQRRAISTLSKLLQGLRTDTENVGKTKRDCRFRLGGHCLTEALDRAANQYYYLRSPDSPGRRRRSSGKFSLRDILQRTQH